MQVFTPYAKPNKTAKVLDNKRLNKQILECCQILSANSGIDIGWKIPKYVYNHKNTKLWVGYESYLLEYLFALVWEYFIRKNKERHHKCFVIWVKLTLKMINNNYFVDKYKTPLTPELCYKHQQLLLQKNYKHYSKYFKELQNG